MKRIKMDELDIEAIRKQFEDAIQTARQGNFLSDKFSFTASCASPSQSDAQKRMHIIFRPEAYIKMLALLREFNSEVAWHGVINRTDESRFLVTDIIVYPQIVTGSTVNTDQDAYNEFMMNLDDETYNHLHFQGHSHVNMGTTPSATDLEHQGKIVEQLSGEDYYVFMIWNKRLEWNAWVYDMSANAVWEKADICVEVEDANTHLSAFLSEAKTLVQKEAKKTKKKPVRTKEEQEEDDYIDKLFEDYHQIPLWEAGYTHDEAYWEGARA